MRGEAAVPVLASALADEALKLPAVRVLADFGSAGAAALADAVPDEAERRRIFYTLAGEGESGIVALVSFHAAETFRPLITPLLRGAQSSALKALFARLRRETDAASNETLCVVASSFGTAGIPGAIELSETSRAPAAKVLGLIGPECIPRLGPSLTSGNDAQRNFAADVIKAFGPAAEQGLIALFGDELTSKGREILISFIGAIDSSTAFEAVKSAAAHDSDPSVRAAAVNTLPRYESAHHDLVIGALEYALDDPEHLVQNAALRIARDMRRKAAALRPTIESLVNTTRNHQLKASAQRTLAELAKR